MKMKRKSYVAALAFMLVLAMAVPSMATNHSGWFEIGGVAGVDAPILNVVVPTDLAFALDPFETNPDGASQITPDYFGLINKTPQPVGIAFFLTPTPTNSAVLLTNDTAATSLAALAWGAPQKYIHLGLVSAATLSAIGGITPGSLGLAENTEFEFATAGALRGGHNSLVTFDGTTPASIGFHLQGASDPATVTAGSVAAFQLYAQMNAFADWEPGDIEISGVFYMSALPTTFAAEMDMYANTHRMLENAELPERAYAEGRLHRQVGFWGEHAQTLTQTRLIQVSRADHVDADLPINFNAGDRYIYAIIFNPTNQNARLVRNYDADAQTVIFPRAGIAGWANGPAFFDIILDDANGPVFKILLEIGP